MVVGPATMGADLADVTRRTHNTAMERSSEEKMDTFMAAWSSEGVDEWKDEAKPNTVLGGPTDAFPKMVIIAVFRLLKNNSFIHK